MWAVVVRSRRTEWVIPATIRDLRRQAIDRYYRLMGEAGAFDRDRRRGEVCLDRVVVSVEGKIVMTEPEREWVPDPRWKVTLAGGECSFPRCEGEAVAVFLRRYAGGLRRYRYCADHLYGRRIIDGVVCCSRRVRAEGEA